MVANYQLFHSVTRLKWLATNWANQVLFPRFYVLERPNHSKVPTLLSPFWQYHFLQRNHHASFVLFTSWVLISWLLLFFFSNQIPEQLCSGPLVNLDQVAAARESQGESDSGKRRGNTEEYARSAHSQENQNRKNDYQSQCTAFSSKITMKINTRWKKEHLNLSRSLIEFVPMECFVILRLNDPSTWSDSLKTITNILVDAFFLTYSGFSCTIFFSFSWTLSLTW